MSIEPSEHEPHPTPLHSYVKKEILPIYKDLSRDDLLERCLGKNTQNANESFNSTIWRLAPKHLHSTLIIVELASYLAEYLFNEGNSSLLMVMKKAEIVVGRQRFNYAEQMDNQRVSRQNRRSSLESKEGRKAWKAVLQAQNEVYEEEGLLYSAGIAQINR
ncbi:uncharacterized protein TNIN_352731 [Trichonephila inaurata madagascariensis]|uniref:Uncharacterized protein n=1 Tax=Trichonephila inaurata madagascariensis TaxID=2747483 RepID=A0A8X6Y829_9ARAC|nr:uncharacterized protein TNIN_352731 [Trichonephila inaurata madagascariensis]